MLDSLRRGANTWIAKVLLALLVASFAVWGIADVFRMSNDRPVASVGDTEISATEFQRIYTRQVQNYSRQLGQAVTPELATALGLPQGVLGRMVEDATLSETARAFGLGISDETLARRITEDPALRPQGATAFDRNYLLRLLADNGYTEQAFVAERRVEALRAQVADALATRAPVPNAMLEIAHAVRAEARSISIVTLRKENAGPAPVPTDDELAAWYEESRAEFRSSEYRSISFITVDPAALADPAAVSAEDARKEYERTLASYGTPETRRIRQILFPTIEEARAASDKIKAGSSFEAIISERGLTPADIELGLVAKTAIVDPKIADAAFAIASGATSDPIEARFGGAIVQVAEIVPAAVRPFEEVEADIRRQIAEKRAEAAVLDTHDEVEDARAGGATLAEIAERFKLTLTTVEVDSGGMGRDGQPVSGLPQNVNLLSPAFAAEEGADTDPIGEGRTFVWYSVDAIAPAADRPLEEVRDRVVAAWTEEKVIGLLAAKADEMAKAVRDGKELAAAATEAGATVETVTGLTRNGENAALSPAAIDAAFGGPVGHVASADGPDGSQIVLKVDSSEVPAFFPEAAEIADARDGLANSYSQTFIGLLIADQQTTLGSRIFQETVDAVTGLSATQ